MNVLNQFRKFSIQQIQIEMIEEQDTKRSIKISYKGDDSFHEMQNYFVFRDKPQERRSSPKEQMENKSKASKNEQKKKSKKKSKKTKEKKCVSMMKKAKIKILKNNFVEKMKLNATFRQPLIQEEKEEEEEKNNLDKYFEELEKVQGLSMGNAGVVAWSFMNIIQITVMMFIYSILMAFPETTKVKQFFWARVISAAIFLVDFALNFGTSRFQTGQELKNLREISSFYLRNGFTIDFLSLLVFLLDLLFGGSITVLAALMALIKLLNNIKKLERFEYIFIDSPVRQQYYGLVKVFLTNFLIGHVLSILLNLMAPLSNNNWWGRLDIQKQEWLIKYIWGYYWGTNIMLTVGFGDLSATNHYQALILIFIETFSCITLAYNINYVGAIVSSIRKTEDEKKKKLKFFHRMSKENEISKQLESKINSFIEQSFQIKEDLPFEEYDQVIRFLPKSMQSEYRKQANKVLFDGFEYAKTLANKSLVNLAELVERKICHPKEILYKKGNHSEFLILQKGRIDMVCKSSGPRTSLDGKIIQSLEVKEGEKPKLLSLDFVKNKILSFDIKSNKYSIVYILGLDRFKQALKGSERDYQLFCMMRDRYEYLLDQNNIYPCSLCKGRFHSRFECSRLHYIPLKQMIVYRYLEKINQSKSVRQQYLRTKLPSYPLELHKQLAREQIHFVKDHFDQQDIMQIQLSKKKEKKLTNKIARLSTLSKGNNTKRSSVFSNLGSSKKIADKIENIIATNIVQNQFWDLETDEAYNFKFYFENFNSNRYSKDNKYRQKKQKKVYTLF